MFDIVLSKTIAAPRQVVWEVIRDTAAYPQWNTFIRQCHTSFEVGAPIEMQVQLTPRRLIRQTETIWQMQEGELLEYGVKAPLGLLASSRQHVLTEINAESTRYDSIFRMKGALTPFIKLALGRHLQRGFSDMTAAIGKRAEEIYQQGQ